MAVLVQDSDKQHMQPYSDVADVIPPLQLDDKILTDDLDKAEVFNKYFLQAYCLDDSEVQIPKNAQLFDHGIRLDNIYITIDDVADQIQCPDCSKSYGPDGIPPIPSKEGGNICGQGVGAHTIVIFQNQKRCMWMVCGQLLLQQHAAA